MTASFWCIFLNNINPVSIHANFAQRRAHVHAHAASIKPVCCTTPPLTHLHVPAHCTSVHLLYACSARSFTSSHNLNQSIGACFHKSRCTCARSFCFSLQKH